MIQLPWRRPLPSNGALYIQQLWASGGQTREPILLKFGTKQQIKTTMRVAWSNIKIFKIQNDGRPPCWKILVAYQWINWDATWVVACHHVLDMSAMLRLPWQSRHRPLPLPGNGALNILQLWASGGRTREPILMKFGTQQHVRTTLTVTWSNIEIFKIQNSRRPPCSKIFEMP